ncbi:S1C family serine protease [Paenibacillus apiarius]|uniref:S1C family serine protease n=1 Tax=Paenibacillus apiarius TaxID=46240 RepID=UPI003B39FC29
MDEQGRKFFSTSDKDSNTTSSTEPMNGQAADYEKQSREDGTERKSQEGSSYYYAYGPYQSVKNTDPATTTSVDPKGLTSDVQVTPPNPVKPLPFSSVTQQGTGLGGYAGGGAGGAGGQPPQGAQGNWQFNEPKRKRRTSFLTIFASFMAGVLVVGSLMFAADKTNLFTGDQAFAGNDSATSAAANAVTTNAPGTPFPDGASSVAEVVKQASPAVVKIETYARTGGGSSQGSNPWMDDPFFRQFFGDSYGSNGNSRQDAQQQLQPLGLGTGFIFDKSGYILTNQHVIEGGEMIQVTVEGYKKPLKAELLGHSKDLDLAVLKITGEGDFPTVPLGNSDGTQVGDWLVAIGNPSGFDHSVTVGVLSARERSIDVNDNGSARKYEHLLQTDASINPGNSGGPLLNMKGEVIGMNVAVSKQAQGIGFAIPSNVMNKVVNDLKANKEIAKDPVPFIGATLATMTEDFAKQMGISNVEGSLVMNVLFGSPAYEADLRAYDIITGMDGKSFAAKEDLIEEIGKKKVGDTVTLQIIRNGKKADVQVKIGDRNKFENQLQQQQP